MRIKSIVVFDEEGNLLSNRMYYYKPKVNDIVAFFDENQRDAFNSYPFPICKKDKYKEHDISFYKIPKHKLDKWDQNIDYYTVYISKDRIEKDIYKVSPDSHSFCETDLLAIEYYEIGKILKVYSCKRYVLPTFAQLYAFCRNEYIKKQRFEANCYEDLEKMVDGANKILSCCTGEMKIIHSKDRCDDDVTHLCFFFCGEVTKIKQLNCEHLYRIQHLNLEEVKEGNN